MKKPPTWKAIRREILRSWRPWRNAPFPYDSPLLPPAGLREFVSQAHCERHTAVDRAILEFAQSGILAAFRQRGRILLGKASGVRKPTLDVPDRFPSAASSRATRSNLSMAANRLLDADAP
jgi:hypothetical protein